jgi:protein-disulfide isomerase
MKKLILWASVLLLAIAAWQPCAAEVDLELLHRITLDAKPLDVAVSLDGRWVYVLTNDARLLIYTPDGALKGTATVPAGSQRIAVSGNDDILFIINGNDQSLETIQVNLAHAFTTDQSPTLGPPDAPVTLTLFTDFECPYCAQLAPVLARVHQQYPREVRIVFKNFPLRSHRFAAQAALAALAAADQGQFWPFHDRLFENYDRLDPQKIEEIRQALNLDAERFRAKMNDPALKRLILRDIAEGNAAGVDGTPTVFVNGKKMRGRMTFEGFQQVIAEALAQAHAPQ